MSQQLKIQVSGANGSTSPKAFGRAGVMQQAIVVTADNQRYDTLEVSRVVGIPLIGITHVRVLNVSVHPCLFVLPEGLAGGSQWTTAQA